MSPFILIRGGGDLASGVALRLHRSGFQVIITELAQPLAVRRSVSFAEAVYADHVTIEGVVGRLVSVDQLLSESHVGEIPVIVDPQAKLLSDPRFSEAESAKNGRILVAVDARLIKQPPEHLPAEVEMLIGLGPGFEAGLNCDAVIETRRSHTLGRVFWKGTSQPDSRLPEGDPLRVLRAPFNGILEAKAEIGDQVEAGQLLAEIHPSAHREPDKGTWPARIVAPFPGILRGLIKPGLFVHAGLKIGDVDPHKDFTACQLVSDKALSIGGGVLEAILSRPELRKKMWV